MEMISLFLSKQSIYEYLFVIRLDQLFRKTKIFFNNCNKYSTANKYS